LMAIFRVRIEKLVHRGLGLGRGPDGMVWLVPFTAPLDLVEAAPTARHGHMIEGRVVRLLEEGEGRVVPRCEAFGRCGGCHLQHLSYERQLALKVAVLEETLARAGLEDLPRPEVIALEPWGWRRRIEMHWRDGRFGYFAQKSHEVVEVAECPIASPRLSALIPALREAVSRASPGPCKVEAVLSDDASIVLVARCARPDAARLSVALGDVPLVAGVVACGRWGAQVRGRSVVAWPTARGQDSLPRRIAVDARGFSQANAALNVLFVEKVMELARPGPTKRFLELYAGAGNITVPIASAGAHVTAVEVNRAALALAEEACGDRVRGVAGEAEAVVQALVRAGESFDCVVADPPRTGLGHAVAEVLPRLAKEVVLCSCDPATLGRDARIMSRDLRVERLVLADMFPETYHIESVVRLTGPGVCD